MPCSMGEIPCLENVPAEDVPRPLETTVNIGEEFAHIHTSPEALRENLITEAVKQGVSEEVAQSYAANTKFSIGTVKEFLAEVAHDEPSRIKSLSYQLSSTLRSNSTFLGTVLEKDGTHYCHVAVEPIAHAASQKYAQYPQEVQEAAVQQELDAIWRHERQHMLQNMNPKTMASEKKTNTLHKAITATVLGIDTAIASCILMEPELVMTHKELPVIVAVSGAAMIGDILYRKKFSPPEREAYSMSKPEHYTRNSPFRVSFEK